MAKKIPLSAGYDAENPMVSLILAPTTSLGFPESGVPNQPVADTPPASIFLFLHQPYCRSQGSWPHSSSLQHHDCATMASPKHPASSTAMLSNGHQQPTRNRRKWTPVEDEKLRSLVGKFGDTRGSQGHWKEISICLPGRTSKVREIPCCSFPKCRELFNSCFEQCGLSFEF